MYDKIEKVGGTTIQHGKYNNRIYLMHFDRQDFPQILDTLDKWVVSNEYSKIFAKAPAWTLSRFKSNGYLLEAKIPRFYEFNIDALFFSRYLDPKRMKLPEDKREEIENILKIAQEKGEKPKRPVLSKAFRLQKLDERHIIELSLLYKEVFATYPFPISDADFLQKNMAADVEYFGVFKNNVLVAASSAEVDRVNGNAEMTDFATLPEARGNNLAGNLLEVMEKHMQKTGIHLVYTIARSHSAGMNITFAKAGYSYSGTLINNTNISGHIESMNVWYKHLK